jgi:hypothetical protein
MHVAMYGGYRSEKESSLGAPACERVPAALGAKRRAAL